MRPTKFIVCSGMMIAILISFPSISRADEWNRLGYYTFEHFVRIPGQVLPPGKYVFKLLDDDNNHNIVTIWNADQTKLYATVLAMPYCKAKAPSEDTLVYFEREKNSIRAIRIWFYRGNACGEQFIY
jgi:hypothetical protein